MKYHLNKIEIKDLIKIATLHGFNGNLIKDSDFDKEKVKGISFNIINIENLPDLSEYKNLEDISIGNIYTAGSLSNIEGIEKNYKLKNIEIIHQKILEIPDSVNNFKELKTINMKKNYIKVLNLSNMENLEILRLSDNTIYEIKNLKNCSKLYELDLGVNEIKILKNMKNLSNLSTVFLQFNELENIEGLKEFSKIKILKLNNNKLNSMKEIKYFSELYRLYLSNNQIKIIEGLDNCINLSELFMEDNNIIKIEGLDNCIKLKNVDFNNNFIEKIENLNTLKYLEFLNLNANNIKILENLNDCINLKGVDLNLNGINKITPLILPNLEYIDLDSNLIKFNDIENLKGNKNLKNIALIGNNMENNMVYSSKNIEILKLFKKTEISFYDLDSIEKYEINKNPEKYENLNKNKIKSIIDEIIKKDRNIKNIKYIQKLKNLKKNDISNKEISFGY